MNCQRCSSLMIRDRAYDLRDTNIHCDVWRCVSCGNMFDAMVLMNREKLAPRVSSKTEVSPYRELTAA